MTKQLDSKYAHLQLRIVNEKYKYVIFEDIVNLLDAAKIISIKAGKLPFSIFSTQDEQSAIIPSLIEVNSIKERDVDDWTCFHIVGEMPFGTVEGLIATISSLLKENNIGICAVSTYKTDLFFVKSENIEIAKSALCFNGWQFV